VHDDLVVPVRDRQPGRDPGCLDAARPGRDHHDPPRLQPLDLLGQRRRSRAGGEADPLREHLVHEPHARPRFTTSLSGPPR
jgi:hypothetical protein